MPPPSKTAPSLSSSRSTSSTISSRPTPPSSPQQERARVLTGSSSLSPSSSRETKSPGSPTTPIFNFGGEICEAQRSSREEAEGGTGGREEEGGSGIEILGGSSRLAAALGIEEEAHEGRVTSPTFKETMAKLQAFGKGGISVVWLKGTMAVSQVSSTFPPLRLLSLQLFEAEQTAHASLSLPDRCPHSRSCSRSNHSFTNLTFHRPILSLSLQVPALCLARRSHRPSWDLLADECVAVLEEGEGLEGGR